MLYDRVTFFARYKLDFSLQHYCRAASAKLNNLLDFWQQRQRGVFG